MWQSRIEDPVYVIHWLPPRSDHLQTPNSGHFLRPDRAFTYIFTSKYRTPGSHSPKIVRGHHIKSLRAHQIFAHRSNLHLRSRRSSLCTEIKLVQMSSENEKLLVSCQHKALVHLVNTLYFKPITSSSIYFPSSNSSKNFVYIPSQEQ